MFEVNKKVVHFKLPKQYKFRLTTTKQHDNTKYDNSVQRKLNSFDENL